MFRYAEWCFPAGRQTLRLSPNHVEASRLCSMPLPADADNLTKVVEQACLRLATLGSRMATIIRAGAQGVCYVLASRPNTTRWVPAYWANDQTRVVDPTGAGNGFMGGLAAALDEDLPVCEGKSGHAGPA